MGLYWSMMLCSQRYFRDMSVECRLVAMKWKLACYSGCVRQCEYCWNVGDSIDVPRVEQGVAVAAVNWVQKCQIEAAPLIFLAMSSLCL